MSIELFILSNFSSYFNLLNLNCKLYVEVYCKYVEGVNFHLVYILMDT